MGSSNVLGLLVLLSLSGLDGEQSLVDVWQNSSVSDGGVSHQSVKFLIVSDGEEDVSWDNSGLLVILSGVSGQFQNFSSQILQDGSQVDWGSGSDSVAVSSRLQESVDSSDWELKSSSGRSGLLLSR